MVAIGQFDIAFAVTSMSRFVACPRKGHLERTIRIFGYLKKNLDKRIQVDSRDPEHLGSEETWNQDMTAELLPFYPDAREEIDETLPKPLVPEMAVAAMVDSDHVHDKVMTRSVTGLLIFVGRSPVFWLSKRQGAIETSTY